MTDVRHTFVCGATRSGKSEAELSRLVPLARGNGCAIVLMDPPGTLAKKFLLHLDALGLTRRVLYDRLADTDCVPGYDWLIPSQNPDPLQRQAENDERAREFAAVLLRRRGIRDVASKPLIEETVLSAIRVFLHQATACPLPWLADVFDPHAEARLQLLRNCTEPELVRKFRDFAALSITARRTETAPAERALRAVLGSPAFRARSGSATFDVGHFLDGRGILILDGSSAGNLSRDAASVMMGAVILRVIQHCRTGAKGRVVLVLDEAMNANLLGLYESQALAEAGKWGLEVHVIVQDPFGFPSPEVRSNVMQNCWRHEWFRQGSPDAARLAAEDIATPLLDPLKVHHAEERVRTVDTGFDRITTISRSESVDPQGHSRGRSTSWQTVLWPRRKEIRSTQDRYVALADQALLMQKELMLLLRGYRFVRDDTVTRVPEYVPMLPRPWAPTGIHDQGIGRATTDRLADVMFRRTLATLRNRSLYRTPAVTAHSPIPCQPSPGAAQRLSRR
jgi:hypothetical protein